MRLELRVIKRLTQRKLKALHVKVSLQNMAFFISLFLHERGAKRSAAKAVLCTEKKRWTSKTIFLQASKAIADSIYSLSTFLRCPVIDQVSSINGDYIVWKHTYLDGAASGKLI